jgi:DNA-binding NarL/FixJ family response regulator
MKRERGRPEVDADPAEWAQWEADEVERANIRLIASSSGAEAYIVSLTIERDRLREMVTEGIAGSRVVADILERIFERGYIDAPANAAAVAALKRQGAADRRKVREMRAAGNKVREIASTMGVTERTVYRRKKA